MKDPQVAGYWVPSPWPVPVGFTGVLAMWPSRGSLSQGPPKGIDFPTDGVSGSHRPVEALRFRQMDSLCAGPARRVNEGRRAASFVNMVFIQFPAETSRNLPSEGKAALIPGRSRQSVLAASLPSESALPSKSSRTAVFQPFRSPFVDSPQPTALAVGTLMTAIIGGLQVRGPGVASSDRESSHFGRTSAKADLLRYDLDPAIGIGTLRSLVKDRRRSWFAAHETNSDAAPYRKSRRGGSEQPCRLPPRFIDAGRSRARSGNAVRGGLPPSR